MREPRLDTAAAVWPVTAVAILTLALLIWPFDLRLSAVPSAPSRMFGPGGTLGLGWRDLTANLLVFIPLGATVRLTGRGLRSAIGLALGVSVLAELIQVLQPDRIVSVLDILVNGMGAVVGAILVAALLAAEAAVDRHRPSPELLLVAGLLLPCIAYGWAEHRYGRLGGWDVDYPVLVGEEAGGTRVWCGRISGGTITAGTKSWPIPEIRTGSREEEGGCGGRLILDRRNAADFARAVNEAGGLSVRLTASPATTEQTGPARILTMSEDVDHRNLTIGQDGEALVVRLRRQWSDPNGLSPYYELPQVFADPGPVTIRVDAEPGALSIRAADQVMVHRPDLASGWWWLLRPGLPWNPETAIFVTALFWLALCAAPGMIFGASASARGRAAPLTALEGLAVGGALAAGLSSVAGWPPTPTLLLLPACWTFWSMVAYRAGRPETQ